MTRRPSEAGYNMVLLIMAVTVLNIMIAAALPYWSTLMKREKEEELIFRGLQYAEGIRLFQRRFGRLPVQLQELIEVEPRCMRQLFKDPMTDDGEWGLLFATAGSQRPGQPGRQGQPPGQAGQGQPQPPGNGQPAPSPEGTTPTSPQDVGGGGGTVGFAGGEDGRQVTVGPIQGVFSRSEEESLMVWNGETQYNRWHFTVQLITGGSGQFSNLPVGIPGQNSGSPAGPSVRWLGRPLPDFIPPGGIPGGTAPDGSTPSPTRTNLPNTIGGAGASPSPTNRPPNPPDEQNRPN